MKCPKCSYLSFDAGERCRNCGYDFSMAAPPPDDPAGDLPLFDDRPLVSVPAAPRQPLSVRRTTLGAGGQDPAKLRSRHDPPAAPRPPRAAALDLAFDAEPEPVPRTRDTPARAVAPAPRTSVDSAAPQRDTRDAASGARRFGAALIDLMLILAIDSAVLYFTLRVAGVDWRAFALPIAPLAAFFVLLNGGYFVMFTAATGQTIGKMAAGIRIVSAAAPDAYDRVTFGRAVLRTAGYLVSLLPAGLGFIPAFVGPRDHRALHDRLAGTRVVRA
ncbi:MAG: RDD family protein [Vicinamibacterales bacterium]